MSTNKSNCLHFVNFFFKKLGLGLKMSDFPTIGKYSVIVSFQKKRALSMLETTRNTPMSLCIYRFLRSVIESVDVGATVTVTMGIDFKDTMQPASFEIW